MECPRCDAQVSASSRFCSSCGHELVVVGDQRRIATVLFADIVGFTAMSERLDPEQVKGLVDRCFERLAFDVESFGGRVDKIVGDAIVALFGAPVAHEDDAERAVRAGLRMQESILARAGELGHDIQLRVGINTGEVLVGTVRAGREYTAMGDVVNTASRLQTAADPGTVLVGPGTRQATRNVVEYRDVNPVLAKGKRLPVEASIAVRALVPPGQRVRTTATPMIGRESELGMLTSLASTSINRSRASLLLIHGEAGMGKSRLAAETACHADREFGALVLEGRCVPYGEANVWWPVAEAVRSAAQIDPSDEAEAVDAALRRAVTGALTESGRLDEVDRVVDGLHHLLGHDGTLRGIDATRARDEAIRSVVAIIDGATQRRPVVIVLSDLHWADQEVLDLVDALLARLTRRPFVVLATARRALSDRWAPSPDAANSVVLHLDPLDEEASMRLLTHLSEGVLHPAMAAMLVDRSGGNPFYLEELVSLVSEAGVHTVDQLLSSEGGELPSTLRGLVAARLDALVPRDRQILDDASVLGRRNWVMALEKMAHLKRGADAEVVRAAIESLAAREFLVLDGDSYSFRSDVIREVAYATLTKSDRARSHAGIAAFIEAHEKHDGANLEQVAHHWAAAAEIVLDMGAVPGVPDDVQERAVRWLRLAAAEASADGFPSMVNSVATRVLALMEDDDPNRAAVLRQRAEALVEVYRAEDALSDLSLADEMAQARGDDRGVAENAVVRADAIQAKGDFVGALRELDRAAELFDVLDLDEGRANTLRHRGRTLLFAGDFGGADESLTQALALYDTLDDQRGRAWALQNLSWSAYVSGRIEESEQRVLASMETFDELGDHGGLTWSRGLLAWVRFHQGRNEEAEMLAAEVGQDARERGEVWGEAMMVVLEASIALWSGRTAEAAESSERAHNLFGEIEDGIGALQATASWARARLMLGEVATGIEMLRTAVNETTTMHDRSWLIRISMLTSAVQIGSLDLGEEALDGAAGFDPDDLVGNADRVAALAIHHLQRGAVEAASSVFGPGVEDRGYVRAARALVAAGSQSADVAAHADSIAEVNHTYLDQAYGEMARAVDAARQGHAGRARALLVDAIAVIDQTGDRVAQAVLRLALAAVAEDGALPDATRCRADAEERLAMLGITAVGWRNLLDSAVRPVPAA